MDKLHSRSQNVCHHTAKYIKLQFKSKSSLKVSVTSLVRGVLESTHLSKNGNYAARLNTYQNNKRVFSVVGGSFKNIPIKQTISETVNKKDYLLNS